MTRRFSYLLALSGSILFLLYSCEKGNDLPSSVTDIDGNVYETVKIGNQLWMAENLRTTRMNDGTEIELITKNTDWHYTTEPAFSWYNNDSSLFKVPYGALYNGYVALDDRVCPEGWHVPDNDELKQLVQFSGDSLSAGGSLKVKGLSQWHYPNTGADNSSNFTALPAGMRYFEGTFSSLSYFTAYWSSSEADTATMKYISLSYLDSKAVFNKRSKNNGFSIRCVRD
jgi:uncharacterized protein (TIGR02145 family)